MAPPRRIVAVLEDPQQLADAYTTAVSIAALANAVGVSPATVRRALIRHGIERLPRNRIRRPPSAACLDNAEWLDQRYRTRTGVEIAYELGVSARTVYSAMDRHGIERRSEPGATKLRRPQLVDDIWLFEAIERGSSATVADELGVSPGTLTAAYQRVGISPTSTPALYARGRPRTRPSPDDLRSAWYAEGTFCGVGRRIGVAHSTATVWLAEVGIFANDQAVISRSMLLDAIDRQWPLAQIAREHAVSVTTVRVELHRHGLSSTHIALGTGEGDRR